MRYRLELHRRRKVTTNRELHNSLLSCEIALRSDSANLGFRCITYNDVHLVNFALNLEYLEGEFYAAAQLTSATHAANGASFTPCADFTSAITSVSAISVFTVGPLTPAGFRSSEMGSRVSRRLNSASSCC